MGRGRDRFRDHFAIARSVVVATGGRRRVGELGKLRDQLVERPERAEPDLRGVPRGAAVAVDHHRRLVAGPVRNPGLRPAVGERQCHERGAEVVEADRLARGALLEELGTRDVREAKVVAERLHCVRPLARRDRLAGVVGEDERVGGRLAAELPPARERPHDVGLERPGARVVGLVRVEAHRSDIEVELAPRHVRELAPSRSLADRDAVEEAVHNVDLRAGHELRVLRRLEVRERLALRDARQEAGRQRAALDQPGRVCSEFQQAREHLTAVPSGRCVQRRR